MSGLHPRRKHIRLSGFDYRSAAYYFITICTYQKTWLFEPQSIKSIAENTWMQVPTWPSMAHAYLDEWVVMPNHIHAILAFWDPSNATEDYEPDFKRLSKSLGSAVATYKLNVTKRVRNVCHDPELVVWQRGYYDRIICDENELNRIREYIRTNPDRWDDDGDDLDIVIGRMTYHP
ncbi:MAG: transposase [Chloroflexota bacterium]